MNANFTTQLNGPSFLGAFFHGQLLGFLDDLLS
jgi:hypothetical protein